MRPMPTPYRIAYDVAFTPRVRGQAAAALGYVNAGDDARIGGETGKWLGEMERDLSFKSTARPTKSVTEWPNGVITEVATVEHEGKTYAHIALAWRKDNGRWFTMRVGWRLDENWGDEKVIGHNPHPEIVGGYIFSIVPKFDADKSFIDAVDLAA